MKIVTIDILRHLTPDWIRRKIPISVNNWLGRRIRQDSSINFNFLVHDLSLPDGETEESIYKYLSAFHFEDGPKEEMDNYLRQDFRRFLYTLSMIPKGKGKMLEIGSNPYFISMLIRRYMEYKLYCSNFFGYDHPERAVQRKIDSNNNNIEFEYHNFNIEDDDIPFEDNYFDVILFCEVVEHLTKDPIKALLNIKKLLKENGYLILSTPNVARLENVAKMIVGVNIYDPYSAYGTCGRHNREYNKHELCQLLSQLRFDIEIMFTSDVNENRSNDFYPVAKFIDLVQYRKMDLGKYIFGRAKNSGMANSKKPEWLYRSYPSEEMID